MSILLLSRAVHLIFKRKTKGIEVGCSKNSDMPIKGRPASHSHIPVSPLTYHSTNRCACATTWRGANLVDAASTATVNNAPAAYCDGVSQLDCSSRKVNLFFSSHPHLHLRFVDLAPKSSHTTTYLYVDTFSDSSTCRHLLCT